MRILDRYILRSLVVNYLIALGGMMSLYVVLDLFFNMDEFTEQSLPTGQVIANISQYYGANLFLYFSQLSGVITTFACLATIARMRKLNELTATLTSGISLYRVAAPVIGFGLATTALWVLNAELIVPRLASELARRRDDTGDREAHGVWFLRDRDNALLSAQQFFPETGTLRQVLIIRRDESGTITSAIEAEEAMWEGLPSHPDGGRWRLSRANEYPRDLSAASGLGPSEQMLRLPIRYYESELDPKTVQQRQSAQWVNFLSSAQLANLSRREISAAVADAVLQARNSRFASPIVQVVLLLLGVPFMLNRDPGTILSDTTKCLGACGACFMVAFVSSSLLSSESFPFLPAWLPIVLFTPVAVVLMDRIRT